MIFLPALNPYTKARPNRPKFEETYLVPDFRKYKSFWEKIHHFLYTLGVHSPIKNDFQNKIHPLYGYFGYRIHPVTLEPKYYHLGIEIKSISKQKVYPLLKGVLEYSGYGAVNGYYVLLSHPNIRTEDGYVLHTMYCHLKKPLVKFSSYQKMLREISLGSHPIIEVNSDTVLGLVGSSGVTTDKKSRLYIQCDFRKFDCSPIVIDPINFFDNVVYRNKSERMTSIENFKKQLKR